MKVSALLHKTGSDLEALFGKLERASRDSDIVIAPDYALAIDPERPNNVAEYIDIIGELREISRKRKDVLFIPGTMPLCGLKSVGVISTIYRNGELIVALNKETDRGETDMARGAGLVYERGDCNKNNINYNGGNLAVEICSDHGHQIIPENTFLEVILAYDQKAGFWVRANTSKSPRHILLCDGFAPKVEGFHMNGKPNIWRPIEENEERRVYELK